MGKLYLNLQNMFHADVQDPDLHLKHLKPSPPASSIVNRCIECGFCESNCPSRDITLTPRQRITTYREISRLRDLDDRTAAQQQRLTDFEQSYEYDGDATCAADGMCQVKCPVKINTGELIKQLRSDELEGGDHPRATKAAMVRHHTSFDCHGVPSCSMRYAWQTGVCMHVVLFISTHRVCTLVLCIQLLCAYIPLCIVQLEMLQLPVSTSTLCIRALCWPTT